MTHVRKLTVEPCMLWTVISPVLGQLLSIERESPLTIGLGHG